MTGWWINFLFLTNVMVLMVKSQENKGTATIRTIDTCPENIFFPPSGIPMPPFECWPNAANHECYCIFPRSSETFEIKFVEFCKRHWLLFNHSEPPGQNWLALRRRRFFRGGSGWSNTYQQLNKSQGLWQNSTNFISFDGEFCFLSNGTLHNAMRAVTGLVFERKLNMATWQYGLLACDSANMSMVTIETKEKQLLLEQIIFEQQEVLGLYYWTSGIFSKNEGNGEYIWFRNFSHNGATIQGVSFNYSNWAPGHPWNKQKVGDKEVGVMLNCSDMHSCKWQSKESSENEIISIACEAKLPPSYKISNASQYRKAKIKDWSQSAPDNTAKHTPNTNNAASAHQQSNTEGKISMTKSSSGDGSRPEGKNLFLATQMLFSTLYLHLLH